MEYKLPSTTKESVSQSLALQTYPRQSLPLKGTSPNHSSIVLRTSASDRGVKNDTKDRGVKVDTKESQVAELQLAKSKCNECKFNRIQ